MQLTALMPDIHTLIPSDYSEIRSYEYERLLNMYMAKAVPSAHPDFVQIAGIPGAGKSTFCADRKWNNRLFISFDAIMENIPAYHTDIYRLGRAGSFKKWEIPARIIGYELLRRAVEVRSNIYMEHSGVNRPHVQLIENLKKLGYRTEMHFILCSLAVAEARAKAREQQTNRHTPPSLIAERYNLVDTYLQSYVTKADSLYIYNTTDNKFALSHKYQNGSLVNIAK